MNFEQNGSCYQKYVITQILQSLHNFISTLAGRKSLGRLAVMSDLEVRSLAVQRCDRAITCADCVALQDPYCAWDIRASRCSSGDWTSNMANRYSRVIPSRNLLKFSYLWY